MYQGGKESRWGGEAAVLRQTLSPKGFCEHAPKGQLGELRTKLSHTHM